MSEVPLYGPPMGSVCQVQGYLAHKNPCTCIQAEKGEHIIYVWNKETGQLVKMLEVNFTEMCSGSEAGSYLRLIDFVYHSTLGWIVIKKKREGKR